MNSLKITMKALLSVHGSLLELSQDLEAVKRNREDLTPEKWSEQVLALDGKELRKMWANSGSSDPVELLVLGSPDEDLEPGQALLSIDSVSLVVDVDTLIRALKPFRAPK